MDQETVPLDTKRITPFSLPFWEYCPQWEWKIGLTKAGYHGYTSDPIVLQPGETGHISAVLIPFTTSPVPSQSTSPSFPTAAIIAPPLYTNGQAPAPDTAFSKGLAAGQPSQSPAPGTGSFSVTTNPAGARIFIDGIPAGASPATIPGLPAGTHNLTITMAGYEDLVTQVNIIAGQTMEFSTTLVSGGTRPAAGPSKAKTPGFEAAAAGLGILGILLLKRMA